MNSSIEITKMADPQGNYGQEDRGVLLDILEEAGRTSREGILDIREQRKGEQIGGTGHQTGTMLSSKAPGLVLGAIKQHAIGKYPLDAIEIVFESANFQYDFRSGKPVLVCDEVDGQKFTGRFQSQRTTLEGRLHHQGWDLFSMGPDSGICMSLFEGPRFEDVVVNVTATMQGDVFSAIKESEDRSVAYINGTRVVPTDFQPPDLRLRDCQIDIMGNTNYNLRGIGLLADQLIRKERKEKYGEVRITSSGSSAIDIVNMIAGKMDAIVDLRALYEESRASLEVADIASMYRFLKAVGFYVSDVRGNPLDSFMTDENVLRNRIITLIVARTRELGEAIVEDLSEHLSGSVSDWEKRRYEMDMPVDPQYSVVTPRPESPFKASYIGEHIRSGQRRFVHIIQLNEDGKAFLKLEGISFEEYLKKECRLALLAEAGHPNIMAVEIPRELADGSISLVEQVCDSTLAEQYEFGKEPRTLEMFYDHVSQMLEGLTFCHKYSTGPVVHGDIKLDNINLDGGIIKWDDFGVSSLVREVNTPELRGRNIGAIDTRAPELFQPGVQKTPRSDVYSLGATLCRMLTGHYPTASPDIQKPTKTDPARIQYEQDIEEFRGESSTYVNELRQRVSGVVEDLRVLVLNLLDRDPNKRPDDAAAVKEQFDVIKKRYEIYMILKGRITNEVSQTPPEEYLNPHLEDTEDKLLHLDSGASYAERLAAFLHDYERAAGKRIRRRQGESYQVYKKRHNIACGKIVGQLLQDVGADDTLVEEVSVLVRYHDSINLPQNHVHLHKKIERVKDADSLSFFDVNLDRYMSQHKGNEERLKEKMTFMFDKMSESSQALVRQSDNFEKISPYLAK